MKRMILAMVFAAALSVQAGPLVLKNRAEESKHQVAAAMATNTATSVTMQDLNGQWIAAKSQAERDGVVTKLFAYLAGVETVTARQKEKDKHPKATK